MADERKIVIELKAVGSADDGEDEALKDDDKAAKKRKKAIKSALKQVGEAVVHELVAEGLYQFGKYTSLSENYKYAVLADNIQATVGKAKGLLSAMKSGALLGMTIGGPGGAAIGALAEVGLYAWTESNSLRRQYDQQNIQLAMGDRTAAYARSRLGLIDNGRGTQN